MNLTNNRVSAIITKQQMTTIKNSVDSIAGVLVFLIGLTPDERKRLPKISKDNKLFVDSALMAIKDNPNLLPQFVSVAEVEKDFLLHAQLTEIKQWVSELFSKISDTQMLAGSEAYSMSLAFYQMAKMAAKAGVPGAQAIVDSMSDRFEDQGPGSEEETDGEGITGEENDKK